PPTTLSATTSPSPTLPTRRSSALPGGVPRAADAIERSQRLRPDEVRVGAALGRGADDEVQESSAPDRRGPHGPGRHRPALRRAEMRRGHDSTPVTWPYPMPSSAGN